MLESNYKLTLEKLSIGEADAENLDSEFYSALERSGDVKSTLLKYETELESLKQKQSELNKEKDELEESSKSIDYKIETAENEIEKISSKIEDKQQEKIKTIQIKLLTNLFFMLSP